MVFWYDTRNVRQDDPPEDNISSRFPHATRERKACQSVKVKIKKRSDTQMKNLLELS